MRNKQKHAEYQREYYHRSIEINRKARERTRNRVRKIQAVVNALKEASPCMDCGGKFQAQCMDYDHRDGKTKRDAIGNMCQGNSLETIMKEIEKCDLVCANCHRIRTFQRLKK